MRSGEMVYPRKLSNKSILCLESHWGGSWNEPRLSVKPLLDYITQARGTTYQYHPLHTPEEFSYILKNANKANLVIFAFHGTPDAILMGKKSEFKLELSHVSEMMGKRFSGSGVHFSSCSVLKRKDANDFALETGCSFVSGYAQDIDYIEGAVMDLAFIGRWFQYKSLKALFKSVKRSYKDYVKENNFLFFLPDSGFLK